jgi:hypothetical protein
MKKTWLEMTRTKSTVFSSAGLRQQEKTITSNLLYPG